MSRTRETSLICLSILPQIHPLQQPFFRPFLDIPLGGGQRHSKPGGDVDEGLAVEFVRQGVQEELAADGLLAGAGGPLRTCPGQVLEDAGGVLQEGLGDGHCGVEVVVQAFEVGAVGAIVHHPDGGEDHCDAESDEPEAAHGGDDFVSKELRVFPVDHAEVSIEGVFLGGREVEGDFTYFAQHVVEVVELGAQAPEVVVGRAAVGFGEDVLPLQGGGEIVEHEAAEKAVLGIRDEVLDLLGRAGEQATQPRVLEVDVFAVFSADIGDVLVVEGLAEAVGVVAVVGGEGVGEGVAFGLEHDALSVVVAKDLIDGGGAGVGGDEEHPERRFLGLVHVHFLLVGLVLLHLLLVFHFLGLVDFAKAVVDGVDEEAAEDEPAFAGGGTGGDEEEEVGPDGAFVVDAGDVGKDGGNDCEGAQKQDVGILLGVGLVHNLPEEFGQEVADGAGEGGKRRLFFALTSSVSLISLIRGK